MEDNERGLACPAETCRVLVIGSHRTRLDKVCSLLQEGDCIDAKSNVRVEYLACVATFASYMDEATGTSIRYLSSVEHLSRNPVDGTLSARPSSLLPLFEECNEDHDRHEGDKDDKVNLFPGISGAAIGSGIEGPEDSARIESFLGTMASNLSQQSALKVRTIAPNAEYGSMKDELVAYKALNAIEKAEVNRLQSMGPVKMAKFVADFARELIRDAMAAASAQAETTILPTTDAPGTDPIQPVSNDNESTAPPSAPTPRIIDPKKNRFACRICRTVLFGADDLEDPAHEPSQHMFSYRKRNHGACITTLPSSITGNGSIDIDKSARCQSYFLQDSLDWMGDDICNGYPEGKFSCPSCHAKLGSWIWSGTQCSCGSWVVPAIQIPKAKVDVVSPPRAVASRRDDVCAANKELLLNGPIGSVPPLPAAAAAAAAASESIQGLDMESLKL